MPNFDVFPPSLAFLVSRFLFSPSRHGFLRSAAAPPAAATATIYSLQVRFPTLFRQFLVYFLSSLDQSGKEISNCRGKAGILCRSMGNYLPLSPSSTPRASLSIRSVIAYLASFSRVCFPLLQNFPPPISPPCSRVFVLSCGCQCHGPRPGSRCGGGRM